ncbi:pseudouridine synthase [Candidatus Mycoplasma mahonii]|uniref:pseudouridine synthase n=1 Tax=Candidatus Mycoplasma mahonii TaxID=3004105 RepID=UPI0026EA5B1D|nr:RluA family pseudouridine synthase [Candidatus Mycoplasma mahonii]WKX02520.1 RluA family pseudouridine synthase [Candidatus Mycoplasma mahonii]
MKKFIATYNDDGRTLTKFVNKMFPGVPKSRIERAFRQKDIKINGKGTKDKTYVIKERDVITIYALVVEEKKGIKEIKANINFSKIYEDDNILIVNKKSGVVVHDSPNCLDNQVLSYLKFKQTDSFTPSHVGRLDKKTSGIMLYAKTYKALKMFNEKADKQKKIYEFKSDLKSNIITTFKIEHDENYQRERCGKFGKDTKTLFWMENNKQYAELVTGRKHQIRASLSKLGVPIYGDQKYGGKPAMRMFLHSAYLKIFGLEGELEHLNGQEFWSRPDW